MILDTNDKEKFMRWLREDAESNRGIVNILEKNIELGPPVQALVAQKKREMTACLIVHGMLASMTTETIDPEDV